VRKKPALDKCERETLAVERLERSDVESIDTLETQTQAERNRDNPRCEREWHGRE
jgi:hypothetical protein